MKLTDVIALPGQAPALHLRTGRLTVESGPDAGRDALFEGSRLVIGTAPSCHLVLTDPAISRLHAEIRLEGEVAVLRDLESRNGTFVEGVRVRAAELGAGQRVTVGHTALRFHVAEESRPVPLWPRASFGDLLGRSLAMRALFAVLDRVARTDATVLVLGETGTGKDLVAQALHEASPRTGGPFVVVDCGAIPESLMEGELFGAVRGAFTGATQDRPGALEQAHGGTLFLDEVGELPLALQPKLLRFLEHHRVKRLGDGAYRDVDVRVLAATNRPLHLDVERGTFREDLFYRLNVITVDLPPLRERTDDIPPLVRRFVRRLLRRLPDAAIDDVVPPAALAALAHHPWPGNVRELHNHVQRMLALADPHLTPGFPGHAAALGGATAAAGDATADADLPTIPLDHALLDQPYRQAKEDVLTQFEAQFLRRLLRRAGGNISAAARLGAVDRAHLYKLMRRHELV